MRLLLAAIVSSLLLTACAVYTPAGSVVVDPNGPGHPSGGGGFCPPGQAKKGTAGEGGAFTHYA